MISLRKGAVFCVLRGEPPPPNFAKIHARVGRGRLERAPRDSIPPRGHIHFRGLKCPAARFATGVAFRRHRPSGAAAGGGVPGAARSRLQAGVPGGRAWPAAVGRCRLGGSSRLSGGRRWGRTAGPRGGPFSGRRPAQGALPGAARGGFSGQNRAKRGAWGAPRRPFWGRLGAAARSGARRGWAARRGKHSSLAGRKSYANPVTYGIVIRIAARFLAYALYR